MSLVFPASQRERKGEREREEEEEEFVDSQVAVRWSEGIYTG